MEKISFEKGQIDDAISIMREAAQWLIDKGEPLWNIDELTADKLQKTEDEREFIVCYVDREKASSMILQWHDPYFWPNVKKDESGFIHKLSIARKYANTGISKRMIQFAVEQCKKRNINYLRLDCAGDRPKLCGFYESMGFKKVDRRKLGIFDVAFYEINLSE